MILTGEPTGGEVGGDVGGVVGGRVLGGVVGGVVGVTVGVTPPVQVTPLWANEAGTGLLPVHEPLNPNDTVPLVGIDPL
jgi:hypothetical protein